MMKDIFFKNRFVCTMEYYSIKVLSLEICYDMDKSWKYYAN